MPLAKNKEFKTYYSISEVAKIMDVSETTLRYWEKSFPSLKPKTLPNKVRQYTKDDIEEIKLIHSLVKDRGFKIAAARKIISANRGVADKKATILNNLKEVRAELLDIKKQLDFIV